MLKFNVLIYDFLTFENAYFQSIIVNIADIQQVHVYFLDYLYYCRFNGVSWDKCHTRATAFHGSFFLILAIEAEISRSGLFLNKLQVYAFSFFNHCLPFHTVDSFITVFEISVRNYICRQATLAVILNFRVLLYYMCMCRVLY